MKYILLNLFFLCICNTAFCQNPEHGIFWATRMQIFEWNAQKNDFDGMGWSVIQAGEYAIRFTEEEVIVFEKGELADNYKNIKHLKVLKREYKNEDSAKNISEYEYETLITQGVPVRVTIDVLNDNKYLVADIMVFEDYKNHMYNKCTIYKCGRVER